MMIFKQLKSTFYPQKNKAKIGLSVNPAEKKKSWDRSEREKSHCSNKCGESSSSVYLGGLPEPISQSDDL